MTPVFCSHPTEGTVMITANGNMFCRACSTEWPKGAPIPEIQIGYIKEVSK